MMDDPLTYTRDKVQEYLGQVLDLKAKMHREDASARDRIWLDTYCECKKIGMSPDRLPELLALIHPDFYTRRGESFENSDNLPFKNTHRFRSSINDVDQCQAETYLGYECIFNKHRHLRGRCEADHIWPHSLGGPSIPENRLLLCKFHNGMKSYNVYHFDWGTIPPWLTTYLKDISLLKQ